MSENHHERRSSKQEKAGFFHRVRRAFARHPISPLLYVTILAVIIGYTVFNDMYTQAYVVSVDGQELGVVATTEEVDAMVNSLETRVASILGEDYNYDAEITVTSAYTPAGEFSDTGVMEESLFEDVGALVEAYGISVNGEEFGYAATEQDLRELLDRIAAPYVNENTTGYDFVEDVDAVTTATVQSSKLISALWDGLNRRPFKLLNTSKLPQAEPYQDGVYRGSYMEGGSEEVAIEFILRDNVFESLSYRALQYRGVDYLSEDADEATRLIAGQFGQLLSYLEGRDVTAVNDLYQPADMVEDADTFAGATVRAPKVISAIWDALNRHAFRIE